MAPQTQKAHDELTAAQRDLSEALMTLNSISTRVGMGAGCACGDLHPCAYHADLINRTLEVIKRVDLVIDELRSDLANPGRSH